jgi:hypothetical protein
MAEEVRPDSGALNGTGVIRTGGAACGGCRDQGRGGEGKDH